MTASTFLRDDATFAALIAGDVPDLSATYVVIPTAWTTYSPTITASAGTITSSTVNSARFKQIGKLVFLSFDITITNVGTGSGSLIVTLPVTSFNAGYTIIGRETVTTGKSLAGYIGPQNDTSKVSVVFYDSTFPGATNNRVVCTGVYEAA